MCGGPKRVKFIVKLAFTVKFCAQWSADIERFSLFLSDSFLPDDHKYLSRVLENQSLLFFSIIFVHTFVSLYCIHIYFIVGVIQKSYHNADQMVD